MPASESSNHPLDVIIAAYLEAVERGQQPNRQQLLTTHPEHADGLAKFFADLDRMQATRLQVVPELDATSIPPHEPKPGTIIGGRYKLLENIGEGGMGSVWVAEQKEPVKRRVAIKLVKAGMDSKQVLARFEAERQALAMMDHPNIAKVFDGGMAEHGRPFFIMEYVKGVPFTEYCDKVRLSLKERLNLFIPVCQAVQHAHHKGIVHRDLKPSNILICLYDGKAVPKVIDFGLAKAMHHQLTEQSLFTGHGMMVGTPLYMSPEQAEHNNLDVDTRTDIYSLGVVLYELLTGTTPLEREQLRTAAYNEVLRLIKEVEPPRPSTRLSGSTGLASIAAQRSIDPRHLQKSVAGDLDWIVMKSLEKERSRRYETATVFARDIERFLNDEAVEACPPSRGYRLRKFIRKHRRQVVGASAVLTALFVGITGATWGWFCATEAAKSSRESLSQMTKERDAKNEALTAEAVQRDLTERKLIEGILRSIGYGDGLTTAELRAFVDWSEIPDPRLKLRVLEIGFEDPATALRLGRRAEHTVQSCVALNPASRTNAIALISARQRDLSADARVRAGAAWLALELSSADLPALAELRSWLSDPTWTDTDTEPCPEFVELVDFMTSRIEMLSPEQFTRAGDALISVLERSTDSDSLQAAGTDLVALAPKLTSEQIQRSWDALIGVLEKSNDGHPLRAAGNGLVVLVPRLRPEQIQRSGDALIGVLEKWENPFVLEAGANGLVALAPLLSPEQIQRSWDALFGVLEKSTDGEPLEAAGNGLVALVPRLSPEQVNRSGDALIGVLEKWKNSFVLEAAGNGLVALVPRLSPEQITHGGDALIRVLEKTTDSAALHAAGKGLVKLASKLSPEQITRCGDALIGVLEKTTDVDALSTAGDGLVALASKLSSEQITRSGDALIDTLKKTKTGTDALRVAGHGLVKLAPKMRREQVTRAWDAIISVIEKSEFPYHFRQAGYSPVEQLAPMLSSEQITCGWDAFIDVLEKSENLSSIVEAESGLLALVPNLNPEQIIRAWNMLLDVLEKSENKNSSSGTIGSLVSLAPKLSPEQSSQGADALLCALEQSKNSFSIRAAAIGLVALAPKLRPDVRVRTAEAMVASLHRLEGGGIAEQLLALMPHLERPTQHHIAAETLTILLDYLAQSEVWFIKPYSDRVDLASIRFATMAMSDSHSLAVLLQHPACVGKSREWMLQRFEELVFHEGRHVLLPLPIEVGERQGGSPPSAVSAADENELGGLTSSRSPEETPPPRRFHTVHAAAAWIQKNWPHFDLEATHPVTWRGER